MIAGGASYNEYKFLVTNNVLAYVKSVLDSLYGKSDPFEMGVVDSIYYDTLDQIFFQQCFNGETQKTKFRIRGYGDGRYIQVHLKQKDMFGVSKLKNPIKPLALRNGMPPDWYTLRAPEGKDSLLTQIEGAACHYGQLIPVIRVKYLRYRFRAYDYRITLDTNVEVSGFGNLKENVLSHAIIPSHVLEVKTADPRPHLPLLGLVRLPQISYSKFFLGLNLLQNGSLL